ncbi:Flp family type IVb pilin [Actinoplanes oblitus]|uniref:Flp family type IVb pilin n=1 Tax=Actinoplanes oblitus TaxID=3040509 RepID=A0ABY8WKU1_9ACTN|nr:Flp family type IVb pilin [Actinoplanes oblitus]WIM98516.1 Flp family type IVb pilin [Actinoplanes oblitus]
MGKLTDEGATAVEYSLLAAIVAGICIVTVTPVGHRLAHLLDVLTVAGGSLL